MTAFAITPPYSVFTGIDGEPLDSGKIYVGVANLDPVTNPVALYWDEALTIAATQPIRTSGGYAVRAGTPSSFYAAVASVSITVKDAVDVVVFTAPEVTDLSSYLPNGTGAVRRSIAGKLQEVVSVTDFGITTASSAAAQLAGFQDALDYVGTLDSGGVVVVPSGDWELTGALTIPAKTTLYLDGASVAFDTTIECNVSNGGFSARIVGTGHNCIMTYSGSGYAISYDGALQSQAGAMLSNLAIVGTSAGDAGVYMANFNKGVLDNVKISGFTAGDAVYVLGANVITIDNASFSGNLNAVHTRSVLYNGITPQSANAVVVIGGQISDNTGWGWYDDANGAGGQNLGNRALGVTFDRNGVNASTTSGHIWIEGGAGFSVESCYFENSTTLGSVYSVLIGSGTKAAEAISITNCNFGSRTGGITIRNDNGQTVLIDGCYEGAAVAAFLYNSALSRNLMLGTNRATAAVLYFDGFDAGSDSVIIGGTGSYLNQQGPSARGYAFNGISGYNQDLIIRTRGGGTSCQIWQRADATVIGTVNDSGPNLAAGNVYSVNGTQVVTSRQAAVTAPAGGATIDTQARTAINDIIARLVAHGLIS